MPPPYPPPRLRLARLLAAVPGELGQDGSGMPQVGKFSSNLASAWPNLTSTWPNSTSTRLNLAQFGLNMAQLDHPKPSKTLENILFF